MANTDPVEFVLYSTDLVTKLAILPALTGRIYFEFNEPGSGEVRIPLDSAAASQVSSGQFVICYYRGAARGGFFIDNIRETVADGGEGAGRVLSVSGRGPLAILEDAVVWSADTGTKRSFENKTKAYILKTLIDEAKARGGLSTVTYDFTATTSSDSATWTDKDSLDLTVGTSLLDVLRTFARTGELEFGITLQAGATPILLSAYKNGIGSDKSTTIYFRVGSNCEEVTLDERGDAIKNVLLVHWEKGYQVVTDATSIAARRRREQLLDIGQAQTKETATTYAAAKLSTSKDPLESKSVKLYDGIAPNLFVDYILGDTITLDKFGVQTTHRILSIQADFDGEGYSHVVLEFDAIIYDDALKVRNKLDQMLIDWTTAHDDGKTEVSYWSVPGIVSGLPAGYFGNPEVDAVITTPTKVIIAGVFTHVNGISTPGQVAQFDKATGVWSAMSGGPSTPVYFNGLTSIGEDVYAICEDTIEHWTGSAWVVIGTVGGGGDVLQAITTDGADIWVGGDITSINSVTIDNDVAKFNIGGAWASVGNAAGSSGCSGLTFFNGELYAMFGEGARHLIGLSTWGAACGTAGYTWGMAATLDFIVLSLDGSHRIYSWDGVAASFTEIGEATGGPDPEIYGVVTYLNDVYATGSFTGITATSGASANNVAKYSGGTWSAMLNGVGAVALNGWGVAYDESNDDVWTVGLFTDVDGKAALGVGVYITDFQSLIIHSLQDGYGFNMGAAIHAATASAVTDSDEFPFWEDVSNALRKITWTNIKATLKTYFDTLYAPIAKGVTNGDSHDHSGGDGGTIAYSSLSGAPTLITNAADLFRVDSCGASGWTGTINGTPSGAVVTYTNVSGNKNTMVPNNTNALAKQRLYNTTRGDNALISTSNGTSTITLTATTPASWASGDTITTISPTLGTNGGVSWVDFEITSGELLNKTQAFIYFAMLDNAAANILFDIHPFVTYAAAKEKNFRNQVANILEAHEFTYLINSNIISVGWTAGGASSNIVLARQQGYIS